MADFVPHPLVTCVARELGEKKVPALKADAKAKAAYAKAQGDREARLKWAEDDTKNAARRTSRCGVRQSGDPPRPEPDRRLPRRLDHPRQGPVAGVLPRLAAGQLAARGRGRHRRPPTPEGRECALGRARPAVGRRDGEPPARQRAADERQPLSRRPAHARRRLRRLDRRWNVLGRERAALRSHDPGLLHRHENPLLNLNRQRRGSASPRSA